MSKWDELKDNAHDLARGLLPVETDAYKRIGKSVLKLLAEHDRMHDALNALEDATQEWGLSRLLAERDQLLERLEAREVELALVNASLIRVEAEQDKLREALQQIEEYAPEWPELSQQQQNEMQQCPSCKQARERQWPPSGLCVKHYDWVARLRVERDHAAATQHYRMREIARQALSETREKEAIDQERNTMRAARDRLRAAVQTCVHEILSLSARIPHTQSTEAALAQARHALSETQEEDK